MKIALPHKPSLCYNFFDIICKIAERKEEVAHEALCIKLLFRSRFVQRTF